MMSKGVIIEMKMVINRGPKQQTTNENQDQTARIEEDDGIKRRENRRDSREQLCTSHQH